MLARLTMLPDPWRSITGAACFMPATTPPTWTAMVRSNCLRRNLVNTAAKPGPRERLLRAAQELTYARGAGVGVDAILQQADVARRSLYQHFGGKDGLIAEVIRASAAEEEARYRAA